MPKQPENSSITDIESPFPGRRRIFFGHQSVGLNILDGIRSLSPTTNVVEIPDDAPVPSGHGVFHSRIGENHRPYSKIDDFAKFVARENTSYDIALMKLCYVDVGKCTDIDDLFSYYIAMVNKLVESAPGVRLVHMTVPLRCIQLGIRSRIKQLVGKTLEPVEDNVQREAYNALLRNEFRGEASLFDLASFEATRPDGSTSSIRTGGKEIRTLYPGYSDDGGHLNGVGREYVAQKLIDTIARL